MSWWFGLRINLPLQYLPTALYVHIPWCIKKCPYCDFNSHVRAGVSAIDAEKYLAVLLRDLDSDIKHYGARRIESIFFGGGTPSLLPGSWYEQCLKAIFKRLEPAGDIEITMEANPGALEYDAFEAYAGAGINRISLGVQSFSDEHLAYLGRIHKAKEIDKALVAIDKSTIKRVNIDLMYGLRKQRVAEAISDIKQALSYQVEHISWYQLTIEANTLFYRYKEPVAKDALIEEMEEAGLALLAKNGYKRYEVSAFAKHQAYSRHNLNYWQFNDYYGIGAGAHSKLSTLNPLRIDRLHKYRHPKAYMEHQDPCASRRLIEQDQYIFEYLLNVLRLKRPIVAKDFVERTGLAFSDLQEALADAQKQGLCTIKHDNIELSEQGFLFQNSILRDLLFINT